MSHRAHNTARAIVTSLMICLALGGSRLSTAEDDALVGDFFPYRAFDSLPQTAISVDGGKLTVAFAPGELALSKKTILDWVSRSVRAVAGYYGRLPDANAKLLIVPGAGSGIRGGTTYGYGGAASRIILGRDTTEAQLERDWVLVHELVHHGFPSVSDEHHWMEEGLATYVEPIARARFNQLSVQKVWKDLIEGLPKGLPQAGDRGLDRTPTWGRTYWGGALFYLLADVEIRRRTDNRCGLQDALHAIVETGGNISRHWPVLDVLVTGDRGTGTHVLEDLYAQMKDTPVQTDLAKLWQELGVSMQGGEVSFKDSASLSAIRRAITASANGSGGWAACIPARGQ